MKLAYLHEARYGGPEYEDSYTFHFTGTHEFMERRDVQQLFSAFKVDRVTKHEHHTTFVLWITETDAGKIHYVLGEIVDKNFPNDWKPHTDRPMYDGYARVKTDQEQHKKAINKFVKKRYSQWHDHK